MDQQIDNSFSDILQTSMCTYVSYCEATLCLLSLLIVSLVFLLPNHIQSSLRYLAMQSIYQLYAYRIYAYIVYSMYVCMPTCIYIFCEYMYMYMPVSAYSMKAKYTRPSYLWLCTQLYTYLNLLTSYIFMVITLMQSHICTSCFHDSYITKMQFSFQYFENTVEYVLQYKNK